MHSKMIS